jgi:hypothetical protein
VRRIVFAIVVIGRIPDEEVVVVVAIELTGVRFTTDEGEPAIIFNELDIQVILTYSTNQMNRLIGKGEKLNLSKLKTAFGWLSVKLVRICQTQFEILFKSNSNRF